MTFSWSLDDMTLREVKEVLDAEVVVGHDQLDMEVERGACADLMSDLLVYCKTGSLLLTGLANHQVIRTAEVLDAAAVVMVRGKRPRPETVKLAEELRIPLLTTKYILFETVGRLYMKGMTGCIEKAGEERDFS